MSFTYIIVLVRYYVASNFFAKRDKRFKASISMQLSKCLYINFLICLSLSSKYFCNDLNIDDNIKFVIQIKIYFVKIDDKTKIDILEKTILYCFIN